MEDEIDQWSVNSSNQAQEPQLQQEMIVQSNLSRQAEKDSIHSSYKPLDECPNIDLREKEVKSERINKSTNKREEMNKADFLSDKPL